MSEEEKEAIEHLELELKKTINADRCGLSSNDFKEDIKCYTTILNLITNQQKEIEQLKTDYLIPDYINKEINELQGKIEEYENLLEGNLYLKYIYYKDLAEEQQKEIKELKEESDYYKECLEVCSSHLDNIAYDQIMMAVHDKFIEKQKIKEKIDEWDDRLKWNNLDDWIHAIGILEELLEEE